MLFPLYYLCQNNILFVPFKDFPMQNIFSFIVHCLLLLPLAAFAQVGGNNTYEFMNLPPSARAAALGGFPIAIRDAEVSLAYQNPSLINYKMDKQLSLNATVYVAGIKYGYAGYADHFGKEQEGTNLLRFNTGIQYINYGDFIKSDSTGTILGEFKADEYVMHFGVAMQDKKAPRVTYGANLKFLYSTLDVNYSSALALDLAANYADTSHRWSFALLFKNIGKPIKNYSEDNLEKLPFEIQLGVSKELKHMPLRLIATVQHLEQFNIRYDNPDDEENISLFSTDTVKKIKKYTLDKIARHLIIGGEFTIAGIIKLDIAYNYMRRQELKMPGRSGIAGFSLGMGLHVKKFSIHYGHSIYNIAGATNHFSFALNGSNFFKKRPVSVLD